MTRNSDEQRRIGAITSTKRQRVCESRQDPLAGASCLYSRAVESTRRSFVLAIIAALFCQTGTSRSDEPIWPQFRGPVGSASVPLQRVPDRFGPEANLLWRRDVPVGHSSPCIWHDRLFLTGHDGNELLVLCYDRTNGSPLWQKSFVMASQEEFLHRDCSPSAPTCCTNGQVVVAYFGAYGLIAFDFSGRKIWEHPFSVTPNRFGTGSSPILDGDRLYLIRDVVGLSAAYCFDANTGREVWSTSRLRSLVNYSTPCLWRTAKRTELVAPGTSLLTSYDAQDGTLLWTVRNVPFVHCPSPTTAGDMLYSGGWTTANVEGGDRMASAFDESANLSTEEQHDPLSFIRRFDHNRNGLIEVDELPESRAKDAFSYLDTNRDGRINEPELRQFMTATSAPGKNALVAVRAGGQGDVTETHVEWELTRGLPYVASPLVHDGRLYYVKSGGFISCYDAQSGRPHFESARLGLGGEYYATPIGVGDRVLIGAERGAMFVIRTGDTLDVISRNEFNDEIYATPAVVENTLYIRTRSQLWAFRESDAK